MNVISAWQVDVSSSGRPLPSFVKHRCLPTHVYHRGTSHLVPTTRTQVTAYAKRPGIKRAQHDALLDLDLALNGQAPLPSGGAQLADSTLDNDMVFPPGIEMIYDERCFLEGTPEAEGYVLNFDESEDGVEASCAVLDSMEFRREGTTTAAVHIVWDLDNKYPEVLDYESIVERIKGVFAYIGKVESFKAYANRRTANYVHDMWASAQQMGMRHPLEKDRPSGEDLHRCSLCGKRNRSALDLRKHFKQLHEREFQKRQKTGYYKRSQNKGALERYKTALKVAIPERKKGFDLKGILSKAGVQVVVTEMKDQSADLAIYADVKQLLKADKEACAARVAQIRHAKEQRRAMKEEQREQELEEVERARSGASDGAAGPAAAAAPDPETLIADSAKSDSSAASRAEQTSAGTKDKRILTAHGRKQPVLCIISNDKGFDETLRACQAAGWCTVAMQSFQCMRTDNSWEVQQLPRYTHADVVLEWEAVIGVRDDDIVPNMPSLENARHGRMDSEGDIDEGMDEDEDSEENLMLGWDSAYLFK